MVFSYLTGFTGFAGFSFLFLSFLLPAIASPGRLALLGRREGQKDNKNHVYPPYFWRVNPV